MIYSKNEILKKNEIKKKWNFEKKIFWKKNLEKNEKILYFSLPALPPFSGASLYTIQYGGDDRHR